ncbi:unnamed protein product [Dracunculus medinensis]|uniref:ULP_PROTEASE domain-containing protein n=1 Tax=Dracunculus medinensis TaxID=318479 RepID=A0A0N4UMX8_DRAME|nr:unnamed protein product [Dracunculus medinensis]
MSRGEENEKSLTLRRTKRTKKVINVINESLKTVKRQRKKQIKLAIIEKSENGKQIRAKRRRAGGISQPSTSEYSPQNSIKNDEHNEEEENQPKNGDIIDKEVVNINAVVDVVGCTDNDTDHMETNDVVRYVEMDSKEKSTAKSKDKKLNDIPELRDSDIQVLVNENAPPSEKLIENDNNEWGNDRFHFLSVKKNSAVKASVNDEGPSVDPEITCHGLYCNEPEVEMNHVYCSEPDIASNQMGTVQHFHNDTYVTSNFEMLDLFTTPTQYRTAQLITKDKTLYVNPYTLVEHSEILASIVDKSGPECKIQLDFIEFDDLQTALRMFCRSPITGARETLGHRNETAYKSRLEKLKRCVVFIGSLQKIIDSKDMNDVTTDVDLLKTPRMKSIYDYYTPSTYRTFKIATSDVRTIFVNIGMLREYSKLLTATVRGSSKTQYFMPQFTSVEFITAMNVMFRKARNGRFHAITIDNLETLYKCSGIFECLLPMCNSFSENYCVEAMMDSDWSCLRKLLLIQAKRRAAGAENRPLLFNLIGKIASFMSESMNILKKIQSSGIADIPMGIGNALMVSVVEKRHRIAAEEGLELIM